MFEAGADVTIIKFGVIERSSSLFKPNNDIVALSIVSVSAIEEVSKRKIERTKVVHSSVVLSDAILKRLVLVSASNADVPEPALKVLHATPAACSSITLPSTVVVSGSGSGYAVSVGIPNDHSGAYRSANNSSQ